MSKTLKLNQVIAIEKGIKSRAQAAVTAQHRASQHPKLYEGMQRSYRPLNEDGAKFAPEVAHVRRNVSEDIATMRKMWSEAINITGTKDYGNCEARADVVVDGVTVFVDAPVTFLLYVEKRLAELRTFVSELPTLDPSERWTYDENQGWYENQPSETHRTEKQQIPIVLYDATEHHPAQTQLVTKDNIVGFWKTTQQSGAIPAPEKTKYQERIEKLLSATKMARESANSLEVERRYLAKNMFAYVFGDA